MKNFISVFLFATLLCLSVNRPANAGDRMVLVERFTSWTCPPCASNNPIMDAWLNSQDQDKVVGISYHMNWPAPGNDGFYLYNPTDNDGRRNYYGVNYIPQAKFDGVIQCDPTYTSSGLDYYFSQRTNILSPVTVIITDSSLSNNTMTIGVLVFCEAPLPNPNVIVEFSVIERFKHYGSPPGTNGEMDFYDIMRKMYPNSGGQAVTLTPGHAEYLQFTYPVDAIWQIGQIRHMIFVQSPTTKEILGAALRTRNFTMLPNPGYKVVNQGQSQNSTYKIKVPYVAAGYNSPVTMTAQVNPPVSGLSVSFPSGNVVSNFPDSVTLQVSSTSSVPAGAYQIVVTGTNAQNRTHMTTVQYLVGENYITVGANRGNVQFKVDGISYLSTQFYTWGLNSTHLLEAISPQTFGATQYVFNNWSNGGPASQTVTIGTTVNSYVVNYKVQYKVISSITPLGLPATVSGGNLYYDSGSVANISISPLQLVYQGQTWYFQNWQGTGNGSYSGNNPSPQITMNNPVLEAAIFDTIPPIGIKGIGNEIPKSYELHQNYPNPFNPSTVIKFDIPKEGDVNLRVYDLLGNEIAVIYSGHMKPGYYSAEFDASNFASGVYFYKLQSGDFTSVRRFVLLK